MEKEVWDEVNRIMEKIKPFIALAVLIWLVISAIGLYNHNQLKKEVRESCGYEQDEKVFCICDKEFVSSRPAPGNPYNNDSELTQDNLILSEGFEN